MDKYQLSIINPPWTTRKMWCLSTSKGDSNFYLYIDPFPGAEVDLYKVEGDQTTGEWTRYLSEVDWDRYCTSVAEHESEGAVLEEGFTPESNIGDPEIADTFQDMVEAYRVLTTLYNLSVI